MSLITVPETFIRGYHVQLARGSLGRLAGWIELDGPRREGQTARLEIAAAGIDHTAVTDTDGRARFELDAEVALWSPDDPVRYRVYDKPLVMSELGGGALQGRHGDPGERWTEEYQEDLYRRQIEMLRKIPFLRGLSPWILVDFRSPRRPLPEIQDFWNRKGLISDSGRKKQAFFVLQSFYESLGSVTEGDCAEPLSAGL